MSINDFGEKIKLFLEGDLFFVLVVVFIGLSGFGLGRLSVLDRSIEPVQILEASFSTTTANASKTSTSTTLVASKSGKKYHFPWCAGALQITEKNKIYFTSSAEARKAGYTPASNCKGLE